MTLQFPSSRAIYLECGGFYDREIAPFLAEREGKRLRTIDRFCAVLVIGGAAAVAVMAFGPFGSNNFEFAFLVAFIGLAAAGFLLDRTRTEITHGLLKRIAASLGFDYRGSPGRPALYEQFLRLKLIPGHNVEKFEDEVTGAYADSRFTLCEAHLEVKSSNKKSSRRTVFHGQLIAIDYPKAFLGSTVVLRDMGPLNALMKPGKGYARVGLASPAFEKSFEAWSTDQVEARDLLDPIVLERFQELERLFGGKQLRAAFDGGKLLIAVETGDRLNIGTMFKPIDGAGRVETILKEFDVVFDLIDVLLARHNGTMNGAFSLSHVKASAHDGQPFGRAGNAGI